MKKTILLFALFYISYNLFAQIKNVDKGPDKCYQKYEIVEKSTKYIPTELELYIYTGYLDFDELQPNLIEEISLEIIPKHESWVKKIVPEQNDLVWCKKDVSAIQRNYLIVKDTNAIKDYKLVKVKTFEIEDATYAEAWKEVLCEKKITIELKEKLLETLAQKSIYVADISTAELMKGIKIFQIENHLPVDEYANNKNVVINLDTLAALGLN